MGRYGGLLRRLVLNSTSFGFLTVCCAGYLTHHVHHTYVSPYPNRSPPTPCKRASHTLRVSLLTCGVFLLLGGTFQSTSPSSLFSPGAYARVSIPAPSAAYATAKEKGMLKEIYRKHGCHTCGTKARLPVIGDHVPPNIVIKAIGGKVGSLRQVFLPHCSNCSSKQGGALTRSLVDGQWKGVGRNAVMHGKPRLFWLAGGLVANLGDWEELQSLEVRLEEFAVQCADKVQRFFS